jgi:hypothetical protein
VNSKASKAIQTMRCAKTLEATGNVRIIKVLSCAKQKIIIANAIDGKNICSGKVYADRLMPPVISRVRDGLNDNFIFYNSHGKHLALVALTPDQAYGRLLQLPTVAINNDHVLGALRC